MIDWQSVGLELEAIILARIYRYHRGVSEFSSMICNLQNILSFHLPKNIDSDYFGVCFILFLEEAKFIIKIET
jgi:hypothetical protein